MVYSYWFKCVDTITSSYYMKLCVVRFQKVDLQQKQDPKPLRLQDF